jgi:FdhE protein
MLDLREAWEDILERRATLRAALSVYGEIFDRWATMSTAVRPLARDARFCRARWKAGTPILSEERLELPREEVEELVAPLLDVVATVRPETAPSLEAFAAAWDRRAIEPAMLLPVRGRIGSLPAEVDLDRDVVAFLAIGGLRPLLQEALAPCRAHLGDGEWSLGVCPLCGAPAGWGDIDEEGRLLLACHLCGTAWPFSRARCPFCGNDNAKDLRRLTTEGGEEGYALSTCATCRSYVKEIDRRERWNGGPPLVEDWGSPHLDVALVRQNYWRPLLPLLVTAGGAR